MDAVFSSQSLWFFNLDFQIVTDGQFQSGPVIAHDGRSCIEVMEVYLFLLDLGKVIAS